MIEEGGNKDEWVIVGMFRPSFTNAQVYRVVQSELHVQSTSFRWRHHIRHQTWCIEISLIWYLGILNAAGWAIAREEFIMSWMIHNINITNANHSPRHKYDTKKLIRAVRNLSLTNPMEGAARSLEEFEEMDQYTPWMKDSTYTPFDPFEEQNVAWLFTVTGIIYLGPSYH